MPSKPMNQVDRLMRLAAKDDSGCWRWIGTKDRAGYGRVKVSLGSRAECKHMAAHRYAHELLVGPIPDGMRVLHRCDVRDCINPHHLFLGTQKDNMRDMHSKGRGPRGYRRDPDICRANAKRRCSAIDAAMEAK